MKIAINGFGRIGRASLRIALSKEAIEVVAINDLADAKTLAHLFAYDTAYGKYTGEVFVEENAIVVSGKRIPVLSEPNPEKLPWGELGVDVVLECTGRFVKGDDAKKHLVAGAKKVVLSAPGKGSDIPSFILGVSDEDAMRQCNVLSNASCTTNCIETVVEVITRVFGVEKAMMTTVHSYTADQNLHDAPHKDLRRARAAAQNIVPTTTGAAIATAEVVPALSDRFDGLAIRVPSLVVSLSDMTFLLSRETSVEEINEALRSASQEDRYRGILGVTNDPVVSSDFIGDPRSSIVDLSLTQVVGGNLAKVISWYDNEWGYSNRLVEMAQRIAQ
jgi:glyceraldehyde 3-phosphate dehydrogenase